MLAVTMLKLCLCQILLLLTTVFFQCASSHNIELHTFSPIHTSTETFSSTLEDNNNYSDCTTNFATLEKALFFTDNNRFQLIKAFYPARESVTLFLNVKYNFSIPANNQTELSVCQNWIWTTGTFYLIESPDVFLFTSLLFVHPENKIHTVTLKLPAECADLAEECDRNPNEVSMLEILTRRLKLYSQYNSLTHIEVPDDNAYAVKAVPVLDIDNIYYNHVNTYFSFTIVFPIPIIIMLTVVCFKGARLQLRVKLNHPRYFPSFAALAAMGMLFSFFVISMDICALIWAFDSHNDTQKNELKQSGLNTTIESHNIAIGTLIVDAVATLLACAIFAVGLSLECALFCCNTNIDESVNKFFPILLCPVFCGSNLQQSRSKEKMNWILAATCIAPIVCFGSHIGFVVLAWLADPKHAGAVSVIYIFMFFYYYVTLKAFYQLLIDGKAGCLICCRENIRTNCCCSFCFNCLLKYPKFNNGEENHQILCEMNDVNDLNDVDSPEKEIENREQVFPDTHISFWAILMTSIFGVILASLQVYSIASLVLLPLIGVVQDTPNYILSLFQVAVFFLTVVITYTIITAEEPVERELVKSVVRNFYYYFKRFQPPAAAPPPAAPPPAVPPPAAAPPAAQPPPAAPPPAARPPSASPPPAPQPPPAAPPPAPDKPDRADVVHKVGNIVGALAYKQLSSHVVIQMVADDDSDDLLRPA